MAEKKIPVVLLNSGHKMPVIGMGTSVENMRLRHDLENPTVFSKEDLLPFDIEGTWKAMEECYKLGLENIGICNYGTKKISKILEIAIICPAQGKLREFCKKQGINVSAWSAYGAYKVFWGSGAVMENPILQDIAKDKGVRKYDTF
ncbi:hypothetical protein LR48_Vigan10g042600 [Vigna angularis]|uniref:NADP-dependent oxidoreductase domain-containing protein n=1 Tax=Phaseolus angularis TaxID=3914 RepID=A0A0L9VIM0_PHAAN|nr:hypothetical protein LR48_Vigan10g042600 [Vigna angularis]